MRRKTSRLIISCFVLLLCAWASAQAPSSAEPPVSQVTSVEQDQSRSPFAPPRLLVPENMQFEDVERRPFIYWRAWANQRLPFGRVITFALFFVTLINYCLPRHLPAATEQYKKKWLRCFGVGVLFFMVGCVAAGTMVRMGLYAPLATVTLAAVQLASLIGLTVASRSVGETTMRVLRLEGWFQHPWLKSLATLWLGVLILSLLTLIPGIGALPRMGNRMLALIAEAGTGAFLLSLKRRAEPNS